MQKGRDLYQIISDTLTKSNIGTSEEIEEITTKIYYDYCEEYYPPFKETPEYKLGKRMLRDVSMQFGGDTGTDADYYDENMEKFLKVSK